MPRARWTAERLFAHTEMRGDCWVWTGTKDASGYGVVTHGGKRWATHRLSYLFATADHPGKRFVLHECDNPSCINPKHLRTGTAKDNADDQRQRGRAHWQARSRRWRAWGLNAEQRAKLAEAVCRRGFDQGLA